MKVVDIATAISPDSKQEIIGIRPGEKLHEQMIGEEDAMYTYEYPDHYKILPAIHNWTNDPKRIGDGIKVSDGFIYSSDKNPQWMDIKNLQTWIQGNLDKIGKI
jgi:FlaA1/EpsC-like NDP-sugar epimerase